MENFFLGLGGALALVSLIMILKLKNSESRKKTFESDKAIKVEIETEDEIDLTEEEMEFIDEISNNHIEDEIYENYKYNDYTVQEKLEGAEEIAQVENKDSISDYREAVVIMYKDGLRPNEIAKKLELGKREVEIILKVKGLLK